MNMHAIQKLPPRFAPAQMTLVLRRACRHWILAGMMASLGLPMQAWANDAAADSIDQELQELRDLATKMLKRIESLEKLQRERKGGVAALPAAPPVAVAPPAPSLKFTPKGFRFTGNTVYTEAQLQALVADDIGKEVDFAGLEDIASKVKGHYTGNRYFLASVQLPRQELSDGVVTFQVFEGRVGKVNIVTPLPKGATISEAQFKTMLSALKPGDLITENSIESPLLKLNDLPGVEVKSTFSPGEEPGTANIALEIQPKPELRRLNGNLEFDNAGSRFAGEYRATLRANYLAPFGIGDILNLNTTLAQTPTNVFGRLGYLAPVGPYGTRVGFNLSKLSYALGRNFKELNVNGAATLAELVAVHPFLRTKEYNLVGQFGLETKRLLDKQAQTEDQNKSIDSLKFQFNGDYRGDGHVNTANLDLILGNLKIKEKAQMDLDQGRDGYHTAGRFAKINFNLSRLQQFKFNSRLEGMFTVSGQLASKNLTSAEKFTLGGANRVRGYPAGEGGGDQGFAASAELRYAMPDVKFLGAGLSLSAFADYGMVWRNRNPGQAPQISDAGANRRGLGAIGVGFKLGAPDEFLIRSDLAWGLSGPSTSDEGANRLRLWFQGIRWF
ncbi:ShlB/FhaC/HecB family hemolysin secretion/activation protein [Massilia sp. W12]|uniref:ShlB/FhaC/HecB family hemolysin secretion/activation protein n=1 Tax=Massilia sp. W12 TaxID=3126507 RepID=UPI0030D4683E